MPIPNTYLSLHAVETVSAEEGASIGAPVLQLQVGTPGGVTQLTLFFRDDDDVDYIRRLVRAIKGVRRHSPKVDEAHIAAYEAAEYLYRGSAR